MADKLVYLTEEEYAAHAAYMAERKVQEYMSQEVFGIDDESLAGGYFAETEAEQEDEDRHGRRRR